MEIEWRGMLRTNNWKMMKKVISKNSIFIHKEIWSEKDEKKSWSLALSSRWPFLMIWKVSQVMIKLRYPSRRLIKNIKRQNKCVRVLILPLTTSNSEFSLSHKRIIHGTFWTIWLSKRFKFASNSWALCYCVDKTSLFVHIFRCTYPRMKNIWIRTAFELFVAEWKRQKYPIDNYVASEQTSTIS